MNNLVLQQLAPVFFFLGKSDILQLAPLNILPATLLRSHPKCIFDMVKQRIQIFDKVPEYSQVT